MSACQQAARLRQAACLHFSISDLREPDNRRHSRRAEILWPQRAVSAGCPAAQLEEPLLHHLRRDAHPGELPYGRAVCVAQYPKQDVLCAKVSATQPYPLPERPLQDLLGPGEKGVRRLSGIRISKASPA
jgi:hypothetical protein